MLNEMDDKSECGSVGLEQAGGILILQLLAQLDQLLLERQEPVTDGVG